jgi:hypothetical protein
MNEIVKCMNEVIFCFDYTNMQDYDKLHYTKINASEVCPLETTENTMTDVQTDNVNDKPIDGPSTITAVQQRRYPERIRKQTKRLITEI